MRVGKTTLQSIHFLVYPIYSMHRISSHQTPNPSYSCYQIPPQLILFNNSSIHSIQRHKQIYPFYNPYTISIPPSLLSLHTDLYLYVCIQTRSSSNTLNIFTCPHPLHPPHKPNPNQHIPRTTPINACMCPVPCYSPLFTSRYHHHTPRHIMHRTISQPQPQLLSPLQSHP